MTWVTNKPTKPGYYWYWDEPNEPEIVLIWKHGKSLVVWTHGGDEFSHLRGLPDTARWQGPIEKPSAQKRTSKKTNPDHKLVVEYFYQKYQDNVGAVYKFHGKEDGAKVSTLLSRWTLTQIKCLIDTLFYSTDEFYRTGGGYSIGVLLANDNKLVQEAKRIHEGTDKLSAAGAKTADSMAKVLKRLEGEECLKLK